MVQLLHRRLDFHNADGALASTVPAGSPGVVGQQPVLHPGQCFEYFSGVGLDSATGTLSGGYDFLCAPTGTMFEAELPLTPFIAPDATPGDVQAVVEETTPQCEASDGDGKGESAPTSQCYVAKRGPSMDR